jgi:hypothetical protein
MAQTVALKQAAMGHIQRASKNLVLLICLLALWD